MSGRQIFITVTTVNAIALGAVVAIGWELPAFRTRVLFWVLLLLPVTPASTWWLCRRLERRLESLTSTARAIADGESRQVVCLDERGPVGRLQQTLSLVQGTLNRQETELQRIRSVLATMADGVISLDSSRRIQFANRAAGELLGFAPSSVIGRPLLDAVESSELHQLVVRLLASNRQQEIEIKWGEENPRSLLVSATASDSDAASGPIIIMVYNLSEVRRLEAMRRDFVANVSHELKTPLSSIKAYAETLSCGAINDAENRGRFVLQIEEQADRLNQLISDLLSLSRIEQGNQLMDLLKIPLARVVRLSVREQQRAADKKSIELVVRNSEHEAVFVQADEDGLRQILINLIDNAIKYTPDGGSVTVGWEQEQELVVLSVEDTGIGIPDAMRERVFERFFRVDKARSRELGGTGLGLAIVKHLAQSFGGSVEVSSELGQGSRFSVRLPLAVPED